jgi:hypothetical protein
VQGFVGIGLSLPDAPVRVARAVAEDATLAMPFDDYKYGASLIPDEDEMKTLPVSYGKIIDPDGYQVEVPAAARTSPISKIILNVADLDAACQFYTEVLGMKLLRRRANVNNTPKSASMCAYLVINHRICFGTEVIT